MKEKIAFCIHRYGKEINGGAEDQCRLLVELLSDYYEVVVLTSGLLDLMSSYDYYQSGEYEEENYRIIRFANEKRLSEGNYLSKHPYCPDFERYIVDNYSRYKAIFVYTFSTYFSYVLLKNKIPNVIFIPTAHREPEIYEDYYKQLFQNAAGYLFNSPEERDLVYSLADVANIPSRTTCFYMETEKYNLISEEKQEVPPYVIYVGRITNQKNFEEINQYFIRFKKEFGNEYYNLKLMILGSIDEGMKLIYHKDILYMGFVSEEDKISYMKNAKALLMPSLYESLSIVLLESLLLKVPVIVNGKCDVTKAQCCRSNGGLYYNNYSEFANALNYIMKHPKISQEMGNAGYRYVTSQYTRELVLDNLMELIEEISGITREYHSYSDISNYSDDLCQISVESIVEELRNAEVSEIEKPSQLDCYLVKFAQIIKQQEQIVIVGAGKRGKSVLEFVRQADGQKKIVFADNSQKTGRVDSLDVITIEEAVHKYPDAFYVITPKYHYLDLLMQLNCYGIKIEQMHLYVG